MNQGSQAQKARTLPGLHSNGDMLVLPNEWNPIGVCILALKRLAYDRKPAPAS